MSALSVEQRERLRRVLFNLDNGRCPILREDELRALLADSDALAVAEAQVAKLRGAYEAWTLHDCAIGRGEFVCKCCAQMVEIVGAAFAPEREGADEHAR